MQVGILMGSDSDWSKINGVAQALDEFGVQYEVNVMSAHRTPEAVKEYAETRCAGTHVYDYAAQVHLVFHKARYAACIGSSYNLFNVKMTPCYCARQRSYSAERRRD